MESLTCLKHSSVEDGLGFGFIWFGSFQGVLKFLCMFLLFGFGWKILWSDWFCNRLMHCLCDLVGNLKTRYCTKNGFDGENGALMDKMEEWKDKSNSYIDSDEIVNSDSGEEYDSDNNVDFGEKLDTAVHFDGDENDEEERAQEDFDGVLFGGNGDESSDRETTDEDSESDVLTLRRLLKIERRRANAAQAELAKERAAAATAADEAMAMILRLQHEKSAIKMEATHYRRVAEEKRVHDQEVIQALQWLVWRHEREINSILEDQPRPCGQKPEDFLKRDGRGGQEQDEEDEVGSFRSNLADFWEGGGKKESEQVEEDGRSFDGNLWDAFENVFYSSLEADDGDHLMTPC